MAEVGARLALDGRLHEGYALDRLAKPSRSFAFLRAAFSALLPADGHSMRMLFEKVNRSVCSFEDKSRFMIHRAITRASLKLAR